jgi:Flp pilus assembly protein TadG
VSNLWTGRLVREEGSELVEYSVTIILLLTMLFGIAAFAQALYSYHFVAHAAREATRWASVNGANCAADSSCKAPAAQSDVQTYVSNLIPPGIDPSQVKVTASWPTTTGICATPNAPGCPVEVQVTYSFHVAVPLVPIGPLAMSSSSQMIITH